VDGSSSKAGPDLFAVGDKFPRRDLIRAVLEPSAEIAVGYGWFGSGRCRALPVPFSSCINQEKSGGSKSRRPTT